MKILILSDNEGWHEETLGKALTDQGIDYTVGSVRDCHIGFNSPTGLVIPGFENSLPDAVMVRAIPDGTFEEVTHRLDTLHALTECGVLIYNPVRSIEITIDKGMTSFLLDRAGIATPPTWVSESQDEIRKITETETRSGNKLVLKPLFGNCGRGLQLIECIEQLPDAETIDGIYYLQRFVTQQNASGRDWRIFVIGGKAVAAMERISDHWITNRARGGKCLPAVLTEPLRQIAEQAAEITRTCYAGVDIIMDEDGNYLVLEVNSVPAWRGLQSVYHDDIARLLVDDLLSRLEYGDSQSQVI